MNLNSNLVTGILTSYPSWKFHDGFFIFDSGEHVLSGYCVEFRPRQIYMYTTLHLSAERFDYLNLNFSDQIGALCSPESWKEMGIEQQIDSICDFFGKNLPIVKSRASINWIVKYIDRNLFLLENEWIQRSYAIALVLTNRESEALVQIESILNDDLPLGREIIIEDCMQLKAMLNKSPKAAHELILEWENAVKKRLGFVS